MHVLMIALLVTIFMASEVEAEINSSTCISLRVDAEMSATEAVSNIRRWEFNEKMALNEREEGLKTGKNDWIKKKNILGRRADIAFDLAKEHAQLSADLATAYTLLCKP